MWKMTRKKSRPQHREKVTTEPVSEGYNYKMLWNSMETEGANPARPASTVMATEESPPPVGSGDENPLESVSIDSLVPTFPIESHFPATIDDLDFNRIKTAEISHFSSYCESPSIDHLEPILGVISCPPSTVEVIRTVENSTHNTDRLQPLLREPASPQTSVALTSLALPADVLPMDSDAVAPDEMGTPLSPQSDQSEPFLPYPSSMPPLNQSAQATNLSPQSSTSTSVTTNSGILGQSDELQDLPDHEQSALNPNFLTSQNQLSSENSSTDEQNNQPLNYPPEMAADMNTMGYNTVLLDPTRIKEENLDLLALPVQSNVGTPSSSNLENCLHKEPPCIAVRTTPFSPEVVKNAQKRFPMKKNFLPPKVKLEPKDVEKCFKMLSNDLKKLCDLWVARQVFEYKPKQLKNEVTQHTDQIDYSQFGVQSCSVQLHPLPEFIVNQGSVSMQDQQFKTWEIQANRSLNEKMFKGLKVWSRGRIRLWRECELSGMSWSEYEEEVAFIKNHKIGQTMTSSFDSFNRTLQANASPQSLDPGTPPKAPPKLGRGRKRRASQSVDGRSSREISPLREEYVVEHSTVNSTYTTTGPNKPNTLRITLRKTSVNKSEDERDKHPETEEPTLLPSQPRGKRKFATKRTYRKAEPASNSEHQLSDRIKLRKTTPTPQVLDDQSLLGCRSHEVENFNLDEHWQIPFEEPTLFRSPREASRLAQLKNKETLTKKVYNRQPKLGKDSPVTKDVKAVVEMLCTKTVEAMLFPDQEPRHNSHQTCNQSSSSPQPSKASSENLRLSAEDSSCLSDLPSTAAIILQNTEAGINIVDEDDSLLNAEQSAGADGQQPLSNDHSLLQTPATKEDLRKRSRRKSKRRRNRRKLAQKSIAENNTVPSTQVPVVSEGPGQSILDAVKHSLLLEDSSKLNVELPNCTVTPAEIPSSNVRTSQIRSPQDKCSKELFNTQVHEVSEGPGVSAIEEAEKIQQTGLWKEQCEFIQDSPASPTPESTYNGLPNIRITRSKKNQMTDSSAYVTLEKRGFCKRRTRTKQEKSFPDTFEIPSANSNVVSVLAEVKGLLDGGCLLGDLRTHVLTTPDEAVVGCDSKDKSVLAEVKSLKDDGYRLRLKDQEGAKSSDEPTRTSGFDCSNVDFYGSNDDSQDTTGELVVDEEAIDDCSHSSNISCRVLKIIENLKESNTSDYDGQEKRIQNKLNQLERNPNEMTNDSNSTRNENQLAEPDKVVTLEDSPVIKKKNHIDDRTGLPTTLIRKLRDPRIRSKLLSHLEGEDEGPSKNPIATMSSQNQSTDSMQVLPCSDILQVSNVENSDFRKILPTEILGEWHKDADVGTVPEPAENTETTKPQSKKTKKSVDEELVYKSPLEDLQSEARVSYGRTPRYLEPSSLKTPRVTKWSNWRARERLPVVVPSHQSNQDVVVGLPHVVPMPPRESLPHPSEYLLNIQAEHHREPARSPIQDFFTQQDRRHDHSSPERCWNSKESRLVQLAKNPRTTNFNEPPVPKVYATFDKWNPQVIPIPPPLFDPLEMTRTITMMDPMGQEMIDIVQLPRPTSGLTHQHLFVSEELNCDDVRAYPNLALAHFVDAEVEFGGGGGFDFLDFSDSDEYERFQGNETVLEDGTKRGVVLESTGSPTALEILYPSTRTPREPSQWPRSSTTQWSGVTPQQKDKAAEAMDWRASSGKPAAPIPNTAAIETVSRDSYPTSNRGGNWPNTQKLRSRSKSPLYRRRHNWRPSSYSTKSHYSNSADRSSWKHKNRDSSPRHPASRWSPSQSTHSSDNRTQRR